MSNKMNVSLALQGGKSVLDVDDKDGKNEVGKGVGNATISWVLTDDLKRGNFLPVDGNPPGFEWLDPKPPAGVFGEPEVGANGNSLSITDNNTIADEWVYMLRVNYDGSVIGTQKTLPTGTINNPVIINKGP